MRADPGPCIVQAAACTAALPAGPEPTFAIGDLAGEFGITLRTLRFYEARGLLSPHRNGAERRYSQNDRRRIAFILQAKRLGFTLREINEMMASRDCDPGALPLSRQECTEQINMLERQKRAIDTALVELRRVYSGHYLHALARGEDSGG